MSHIRILVVALALVLTTGTLPLRGESAAAGAGSSRAGRPRLCAVGKGCCGVRGVGSDGAATEERHPVRRLLDDRAVEDAAAGLPRQAGDQSRLRRQSDRRFDAFRRPDDLPLRTAPDRACAPAATTSTPARVPNRCSADFKAFVATVHGKLPKAEILYISQPPTIARWDERDALKKLNALVADLREDRPAAEIRRDLRHHARQQGPAAPGALRRRQAPLQPGGIQGPLERVRPYIR